MAVVAVCATRRCASARAMLFEHLDLDVAPGEFLAVLGPNGAGKTTLLRVLLGLTRAVGGHRRGRRRAAAARAATTSGTSPSNASFDRDLPIRGRDLVRFGLDGHRRGLPFATGASRARVDEAIAAVGAERYAGRADRDAVGRRAAAAAHRAGADRRSAGAAVRRAAAVARPRAPAGRQRADRRAPARRAGTAVVFVTHEINPILPYVDRVLYLVGGRWAVGTPDRGADDRGPQRPLRHRRSTC